MFLLCVSLLLLILSGFCFLRHHCLKNKDKRSDWDSGAIVFGFFCIVIFIVSFIITGVSYSTQISNCEELTRLDKVEVIYKNKADQLTKVFAKHLAQLYPEFEKEIFDNISPKDIDIYLVKYPELKSSQTILELTKQINLLQSDVYQVQLNREMFLKNMRFNVRNPWIFYWWIPTIEELKDV